MIRLPISQSASDLRCLRSSDSRRRTRADLRELIVLERAAKQACFVPIPRAVSRPAKLNAGLVVDRGIKFNRVDPVMQEAANGQNQGAAVEPARASDTAARNTFGRSVMLVVDQRLAMRFGSRSKTKSVIAAEIAAFIAWRGLAQDACIGALVFNDKKVDLLWPTCSRLSVMLILHAVLNQNHSLSHHGKNSFNPDMLNRALHRVEQFATNDLTVFLITDASGYDEETHQLLARISQHTRLRLVLVYDPRQKKFSNTRWLFSKKFTPRLRVQSGRDESRAVTPRSRSKILAQELSPGPVPVLRFSTWENLLAKLRRASRKSILPPQSRPARSARQRLNGHEIASDRVDASDSKERALQYDEPDSAATSSFRTRPL